MTCNMQIGLVLSILIILNPFEVILLISYLNLSTNLQLKLHLGLHALPKFTQMLLTNCFPEKKQYGKLIDLLKPMPWKKYFDCARLCRLAITSHLVNKIVSSNKIGNFYKFANNKLSCKTGVGPPITIYLILSREAVLGAESGFGKC